MSEKSENGKSLHSFFRARAHVVSLTGISTTTHRRSTLLLRITKQYCWPSIAMHASPLIAVIMLICCCARLTRVIATELGISCHCVGFTDNPARFHVLVGGEVRSIRAKTGMSRRQFKFELESLEALARLREIRQPDPDQIDLEEAIANAGKSKC
jgi:hypothetical protein